MRVVSPALLRQFDRAALPERFKPQRRIKSAKLSSDAARVAMLSRSFIVFENAAMIFNRYLQADRNRARFPKII